MPRMAIMRPKSPINILRIVFSLNFLLFYTQQQRICDKTSQIEKNRSYLPINNGQFLKTKSVRRKPTAIFAQTYLDFENQASISKIHLGFFTAGLVFHNPSTAIFCLQHEKTKKLGA